MTDRTTTTLAPGRRGLLGGAAALLAGAAAVALPRAALAAGGGPDAALLTLHRDFLVQVAVIHAWNADEVSEEIGEAANDRWWDCLYEAEEMPVHTLAGLRAKADMALKGLELVADSQHVAEDVARATLADVAAWGALS